MKKLTLFLCAVFALAVLAGCSRKSTKDEYGIYHDLEETKKVAHTNNKKILLIFTKLDSGRYNETLVNDILHAPDYAEKIGAEFETCVIDFSNEKVKSDAKEQKEQNERDMRVAVIYGVEAPPTVMVLTAKGYVISVITYLSSKDVKEFANLVEVEREKISDIDTMLAAVEKSSGLERVAAIDLLYESTASAYRYQLNDLVEDVIKTDKKNESGLLGKYLMARATTEAMDCYTNHTPEKMADCYIKPIKSGFLSVEQKQQSYLAAAYVIGNTFTDVESSEKILEYLNAAIELDETTQLGQHCKYLAERQKNIMERQKNIQAQKAQEEADE